MRRRLSGARRKAHVAAILVAVAFASALAAGCGGSSSNESTASSVRVALVTDIGGLNDRGFNSLANRGLQRAKRDDGVDGRVFISKAAADYVPNLSTAARQGYDLVIAVGFLMGDAVANVAKQFPETKFAIIDFPWQALAGAPPNVAGLVFAEQQAGYLVGTAAAMVTRSGTVSAVGGQAVPAVVSFLAGYRAGAKSGRPSIRVRMGYSQDFVDQAKCKELALNQIAAGSDVVFAAAGGCGLGAIQAARDRGVWAIGVDSDQAFLGPHVLTSATKKVDVAVEQTVAAVESGTFRGGRDRHFDVGNGGVGYGKISPKAPNRAQLIETLKFVSQQLADGVIEVPST